MIKNKKGLIASILSLVGLGLIIGFGSGFILNKLNIGGIVEALSIFLSTNAFALIIVFCSLFAGLGLYFYMKAKKEVEEVLREDGFIETKYIDYVNALRDAGLFTLLSFIIIIYNEIK